MCVLPRCPACNSAILVSRYERENRLFCNEICYHIKVIEEQRSFMEEGVVDKENKPH